MEKKLYIETFGCQMNVHDTEKAISVLSDAGYNTTDDPHEADLVLLNTCMVREKAARKVFNRIESLRYTLPRKTVYGVMGCVAQAEAGRIFEQSPVVKVVIGTQAITQLPTALKQLEDGFDRFIDVGLSRTADFLEISAAERKSEYSAFVTIIEGCDKFCSFCIVPFTRGRERSRPAERILREVQELRARGFNEVQLLGQNVNSYNVRRKLAGQVDDDTQPSFAGLLRLLATESGMPRIKYTTSHPRDFDGEIVDVMDAHDALCEWVHLPVQSGSDRTLRAMRRGYTREDYLRKIELIKTARKDMAITSDIIIGFPGETEEDFGETLSLVAKVEYDGLYIFNYSPRAKTPAAAYADTVPDEVKRERFDRLNELQRRIQRRRYERYVGRTVEVLVEGFSAKSAGDYTGHSRCNKVVNFPIHDDGASLGKVINVRVTEAKPNSLYGEGHL